MKVFVKYCGGCNPAYDRVALVREITNTLRSSVSDCQIVYQNQDADYGILICGCDACCIDQEDNRANAPFWIVVGPDSVDYYQIPQREISFKILSLIMERTVGRKES
ncbi:MAG: hypothetical protein ACM3NT_03290 [Methylocystaceae bacterium]